MFGIPTHKHKVAPKAKSLHQHGDRPRSSQSDNLSPDAFLRSIFFRRPVSAEAKRLSTELTPRSGARPLNTSLHTRRRSASQTPRPSPLRLSRSIDTDDNMDYFVDNASMASSRRPLLMVSSATPFSTLRSRRTVARAEPLSLGLSLTGLTSPEDLGSPSTSFGSGRSMPDAKAPPAAPEDDDPRQSLFLAKAVVVSGLEHASLQAQRSLSQALAQRRLVLDEHGTTWNLPDDFLLVYVCRSDPQERPPLLRGLVRQ